MKNSHRLDKENVEDILAVTPMQAGMLFHYFSEPGSRVYFEQCCYRLKGTINSDALKKAWRYVVQNNEMLRAVFRWKGIRLPVQIILKDYDIPVSEYDFSCLDGRERQRGLENTRLQDQSELIDIETKPFRVILCKLSDDEYEMIVSTHHVIYDGWSNAVLLKELLYAYNEYLNNREPPKIVKTKYKELIKWHQKQDEAKHRLYWKKYLDGYTPKNLLNIGNAKKSAVELGKYSYKIESKIVDAAYNFIKQEQITLAALIYTAWSILLHRYSGQEDIVFGITMSGRTSEIAGVEDIVGLFINTLPIRVRLNSDTGLAELLREVNRSIIAIEEFQGTPLFDIKQYCTGVREGQLFDTIVVIQNYPVGTGLEEDDQCMSITFSSSFYLTNFNLSLGVRAFKGLQLDFDFDVSRLDTESVEKLCRRFVKIVDEIACRYKPGMKVKDVGAIDLSDSSNLLDSINNTRNDLKRLEEVDFDEVF